MSDYDGVLLEDINHKLDAILESQAAMANVPGTIDDIDERLQNVESDVKVIKAAAMDLSQDHTRLTNRVMKIEKTATL